MSARPSSAVEGPGTPEPSPDLTPPNPRLEAQRLLGEGGQLAAQALEALRSTGDTALASDRVGHASDLIGSALYFIRQAGGRGSA